MTTETHWTEMLTDLFACSDAVAWARKQPDLATAWAKCERADWMLWLAARTGWDRRSVVLAACDCVETTVPLISDGGHQMAALLALHIACEWCEGREDPETVQVAASAASASYASYASSYASYASAASASYAASCAASASYAASASCAASCAASASYAAGRKRAMRGMADLVRARMPEAPRFRSAA